METTIASVVPKAPWNKCRLTGQKPPLRLKEIWAIRIRLQLAKKVRDLALFNLAIDSKLRGCDLVALRVRDVLQGNRVTSRAIVMQKKTQRPVQFEITEQTRDAVANWIASADLKSDQYLFQAGSRRHRASRPGRTFGSSALGCRPSGWIRPPMGPTQCVARRRP